MAIHCNRRGCVDRYTSHVIFLMHFARLIVCILTAWLKTSQGSKCLGSAELNHLSILWPDRQFGFFIFPFHPFPAAMRFRVAALALGISLQPPYQRAGCIVRSFDRWSVPWS